MKVSRIRKSLDLCNIKVNLSLIRLEGATGTLLRIIGNLGTAGGGKYE